MTPGGKAIDGVEYKWDRAVGHDSKSSACIKKTAQRYFPIAQWSQTVPNSGKTSKVKLSAWVKADNARKAILDVSFTAPDRKASHQWAAYIGPKKTEDPAATHDWKLYEGVVAVPKGTKDLEIALQTYGPGTIWFDDVKIEHVADSTPASLYDDAGNPRQ